MWYSVLNLQCSLDYANLFGFQTSLSILPRQWKILFAFSLFVCFSLHQFNKVQLGAICSPNSHPAQLARASLATALAMCPPTHVFIKCSRCLNICHDHMEDMEDIYSKHMSNVACVRNLINLMNICRQGKQAEIEEIQRWKRRCSPG